MSKILCPFTALLATLAACGSGESLPPLFLYGSSPGDLTTNTVVQNIPIRASVDSPAPRLDELMELAPAVRLYRYPELEPVETTVRLVAETLARPNSSSGARESRIELEPIEPLEPSWYVLALVNPPSWVGWVHGTGAPEPPIGVFAARFHPASNPVIRQIQLCATGVNVTLSELVVPPAGSTFAEHVTIDRAGAPCEVHTLQEEETDGTDDVPVGCPSAWEVGTTRITVRPGLASPEGVQLRTFDGQDQLELTLTPEAVAQLPQRGGISDPDGCFDYRF